MKSNEIVQLLANDNAGAGFVEHAIWGRQGRSRIFNSLSFDEFVEKYEVGKSGLVYDRIVSIERIEYSGSVFDITVGDKNHNFIAEGIVVSNCGVRLIKTNLRRRRSGPSINPLLDALFKNVPSGVGSRLKTGFTKTDLEKISEEGAGYAIEKGYGMERRHWRG